MLNHLTSVLTTVLPEGALEAFMETGTSPHIIEEVPEVHPELIQMALKEPEAETHTMSIRKSRPAYDKYISMRSTSPIKHTEEGDELSAVYEMLFGKDTTKTAFQEKVDAFVSRQSLQRHRLGASAASKKLTTVDGTIWTGEVYLGTEKTPFDVVFDSSSDWLVVEGVGCANCDG